MLASDVIHALTKLTTEYGEGKVLVQHVNGRNLFMFKVKGMQPIYLHKLFGGTEND